MVFKLKCNMSWKGNDQELIQTNPISQPQNQKEKKHAHESTNIS